MKNKRVQRLARDRQRKVGKRWTRPDFEYWWRNIITKIKAESY